MNKQTKQSRNSIADLGLLYFSVIVACWYHLGVYLGCETGKKKTQAFCALTELASCQPLSSSHIQEDIFITLPCVQTQEPEQTALLNFIFSSPSQTKCIIKYRGVQTLINLGTLRPLDVGVYFEGISRAVRFGLFACIRSDQ